MFARNLSLTHLFLTCSAVAALLLLSGASPAAAQLLLPCQTICSCDAGCSWICDNGGSTTNCGAYGLCETSTSCTQCSCGNYIYGTSDDDTLNGTSGNDCIYGREGEDTINGLAGNDKLYGEGGEDSLDGGSGNDCLFGGPNGDYLDGGSGYDELRGNGGPDTCVNGELYLSC